MNSNTAATRYWCRDSHTSTKFHFFKNCVWFSVAPSANVGWLAAGIALGCSQSAIRRWYLLASVFCVVTAPGSMPAAHLRRAPSFVRCQGPTACRQVPECDMIANTSESVWCDCNADAVSGGLACRPRGGPGEAVHYDWVREGQWPR